MSQQIDFVSDFETFRAALEQVGRRHPLSLSATRALFDYLKTGEYAANWQGFDAVELCCAWTEYNDATEAATENGWEKYKGESKKYNEAQALTWLRERADVIVFKGGVIITSYSF